jgi:hypothetical protein
MMSEKEIEQRCVEEVFCLEYGTLDERGSRIEFTAPDKWGDESERSWRYSYDGIPDYAESDYPDRFDGNVAYLTLVEVGVTYESYAPEWLRMPDGKVYVKVADFNNSGERECQGGYDCETGTDGHKVGTTDTEGMKECPMCEEKAGEDHGYIYIGDSIEHVYKHVEFECDACGDTRAERMESDDVQLNGMCQCAADES